MALSYNINTTDDISLDDFVNNVAQKIDVENEESLIECVEDIHKLSNNREFLLDILHKELLDIESYSSNNSYSAQTTILCKHEKFFVRVNAWEPLSEQEDKQKWQNELFFYGKAHDHNFSLLTVGYYGLGYETDMWEYDYNKVVGEVGEQVDLTFLENTTLPKGKAMIYRMSKDIHSQFASKDYSISLNLIPITRTGVRKEQFFFDTDKKIISGLTSNEGTGRYFLLNLAGYYGNNKTLNLVEGLAFNHQIPFIRMKSYDAMAKLTGNKKDVWELALKKDNDKTVTAYAKTCLNLI